MISNKNSSKENMDHLIPMDVINPMAFDGVGPSNTCMKICDCLIDENISCIIFSTRYRHKGLAKIISPYGNIHKYFPYNIFRITMEKKIYKMLIRDGGGENLYVWPSCSLDMFGDLRKKYKNIFLETINFYTEKEKNIIEQEMKRENFYYKHYVTEYKIESQKRMLRDSDVIFCSSKIALESFLEYGCDESKIKHTKFGVDKSFYDNLRQNNYREDKEELTFLFVGRINLEKGVHHLLRAWRNCGFPGSLHLYGDLDVRFYSNYRDLFNHSSIKVFPFRRDIRDVYGNADCFIFLSLSEGGPLVTLEAAASGLPMIVSRNGGGDISIHDKTALVVDPHDIDSVCDAITNISNSVDLRRRLGESARNLSREFSWEGAASGRAKHVIENFSF